MSTRNAGRRGDATDVGSRLSVVTVIPTYNPGAYLDETLRSLERQTMPPAEVIVVDDGSDVPIRLPDVTLPIQLIRTPRAGISSTRNTGVRASTSPLVHICDHDDLVDPGFYERIVQEFSAFPASDVIHTSCGIVDADGNRVSNVFYPLSAPRYDPPRDALATLLQQNVIGSVSAVFRRQTFDLLGGFHDFHYVQDWDFWIRAAASEQQFRFVPQPFAWHRSHPGQVSAKGGGRSQILESMLMLKGLDLPRHGKLLRARAVAGMRLRTAVFERRLTYRTLRQIAVALPLRPKGAFYTLRGLLRASTQPHR